MRALLRLLLYRGHECRIDAYVVAEARRNLVRKGPQAVQASGALLSHLQVAPALVGAVDAVELKWLPPKERPVLASAIRQGCDVLVSGDRKHFGSAYGLQVGGVTIHSPRSLAEAVLA